jgi:hypothetical protein
MKFKLGAVRTDGEFIGLQEFVREEICSFISSVQMGFVFILSDFLVVDIKKT